MRQSYVLKLLTSSLKVASLSIIPDAIYAFIFEARKAPPSEMVHRPSRQTEEENYARINHNDSRKKTQNVLIPRVERLQDCLQKVRHLKSTRWSKTSYHGQLSF